MAFQLGKCFSRHKTKAFYVLKTIEKLSDSIRKNHAQHKNSPKHKTNKIIDEVSWECICCPAD